METQPESSAQPAETAAPQGPISLSPKAVQMVKMTRQQENLDEGSALRVAVRGGGCSGFEYALDFDDEARETDFVLEYDGLTVYIDPVSARYLEGTEIDYVFSPSGAGFKFNNPKASGTCGCGSSFAV
ncbi:MAG: iron-sulfur cluster assembly accessory protein [Thermoanaerobaculia bacterium]|nr:iron-sulfur cluster assembly accessory protein [Thermoanaerobaculia bacterium]